MAKQKDKPKAKFDFAKINAEINEDLEKAAKKKKTGSRTYKSILGTGNDLTSVSQDSEDYVVLPTWWKETYGVPGLPFGKLVQIAGDSDTGKTSLAITAMKAAQDQGCAVIYVETEGKTATEEMTEWGVDLDNFELIKTKITEEAFDKAFRVLEKFEKLYPDSRILFIFDSFGNTISLHDEQMDIVNANQKVGGSAKTNRLGLGKLLAKMERQNIAVLLVNYTYDNIGTHGKTQAGGKALKFYTVLGINAAKTGEWHPQRQGVKVKAGTFVKWTIFKNQLAKSLTDSEGDKILLPTEIKLKISAEGIQRDDRKEKED
ncbi:MAG: hypothetical protein DRP09_14035 [Candidatus Thorarchaeota archaeon]|nr:MAG: hypothetical protein DRP09_14035 [Candidatus Thorarchaeota archaeon]